MDMVVKDDRPQTKPPRLRVTHVVVVLLVLAAFAGVGWWIATRPAPPAQRGGRFMARAAMPVVTAAAEVRDLPIRLNGLGTVTALATVTVHPQVGGRLLDVDFQEGQKVVKGDVLAHIDPRSYQFTLDQAQAQLARDQALLGSAQSDLELYKRLVTQSAVSKQQRDNQEFLVAQDQGTVRSDQAAVDTAKLNLSYTTVTAPIAGRAGFRQVDAGNLVSTTDTNGLVVLTQMQPISVVFTLPEDALSQILKRLRDGAKLPVTAFDRGQTKMIATGTLSTVDNQIDTGTGTIKLRAEFANNDEALFPNQFVNVQLLVDTASGLVTVPVAGIQHGAPGSYVYRVNKADNTVSVVPVELGVGDGERVAVTKGLAAGDLVVIDGADKLREGAAITLSDAAGSAAPAAKPAAGGPPAAGAPDQKGDGSGRPQRSGSPGEHRQNQSQSQSQP